MAMEIPDELAELRKAYESVERELLREALERAGSVAGAARLLGCQRSTLQRALTRHPSLTIPRELRCA